MSLLLSLLLYQQCEVVSGRVASCPGTTFTGEAVVHEARAYRRCQIANGRVTSCSTTFSGWSPVFLDGRWKRCRISTGKVQFCEGTSWSGPVITRR